MDRLHSKVAIKNYPKHSHKHKENENLKLPKHQIDVREWN